MNELIMNILRIILCCIDINNNQVKTLKKKITVIFF